MRRARFLYWVNISAVSTLLLISENRLHQIAGLVVLVGASAVLRCIQRASEQQGAFIAVKKLWHLATSDQEDLRSD